MAISQYCHIIYQQLHYHSMTSRLYPTNHHGDSPSNKAREAHVTELHVALPRAKAALRVPQTIGWFVNLGETQPPMNIMWVPSWLSALNQLPMIFRIIVFNSKSTIVCVFILMFFSRMWVKQCHKPPMTRNGKFIPPIKMVMTGGWFMIVILPTLVQYLAICTYQKSRLLHL